jgi:hypothetical protein
MESLFEPFSGSTNRLRTGQKVLSFLNGQLSLLYLFQEVFLKMKDSCRAGIRWQTDGLSGFFF